VLEQAAAPRASAPTAANVIVRLNMVNDSLRLFVAGGCQRLCCCGPEK